MFYKIFHQNIFEVVDVNSVMLMTASMLVVGYVWTCMRVSRRPKTLDLENKPHRVLLITAHPDDECMFFGPAIQRLSKIKDIQLYLMCLSIGNLLNSYVCDVAGTRFDGVNFRNFGFDGNEYLLNISHQKQKNKNEKWIHF